jgi:hypothetical protein
LHPCPQRPSRLRQPHASDGPPELKQNGTWNRAVLDASGTQVQGTVIGQRQLWQLDATTADGVALVIDSARDVPAIAELGVY